METNLKTIQQQKVSLPEDMNDKLAQFPPNNILNVLRMMKEANQAERIWFDFELPSNGLCGYPKNIKLRELTTEDEKTLIKEMFGTKENAISNVLSKCAKFEEGAFDWDNLTTFDQDFIMVELSALTFPGEKDVQITDEANHKITLKINKEELTLTKLETEYPFKVKLDNGMIWHLSFMTLGKIKRIEKLQKAMTEKDHVMQLLTAISQNTEKVEMNLNGLMTDIQVDTWMDYVRLAEALKASDLRKLMDVYNANIGKYGYTLTKEYYCSECNKTRSIELEPLSFFRISL